MIISDYIIISLMSFTSLAAPVNTNYDFGAKFSSTQNLSTLVMPSQTNYYYMDFTFGLNGKISFNDSSAVEYQVSDISINLISHLYYVNANGIMTLENTVSYTYRPNITFTQTASSPFANFKLVYGCQYEDDEVYVKVFDDQTIVWQNVYETDASLSVYNSNATYVIDNSYLLSSLGDFVNNYNGDVSALEQSYNDGYSTGHTDGYTEGYRDGTGHAMNPEMFTIFNGILNVAMVPVNVFLGIFNFQVFGINIASLVSSFLSIAILVIVIRVVFGGKKGD